MPSSSKEGTARSYRLEFTTTAAQRSAHTLRTSIRGCSFLPPVTERRVLAYAVRDLVGVVVERAAVSVWPADHELFVTAVGARNLAVAPLLLVGKLWQEAVPVAVSQIAHLVVLEFVRWRLMGAVHDRVVRIRATAVAMGVSKGRHT